MVETHIHLDKACILDRCAPEPETGPTEHAARVTAAKENFTVEDVRARASRTLEKCILNGATRMRTHVEIDPPAGLICLEGVMLAAQDYAWAIDVEICIFPQEGLTGKAETDAFLVEALDLVPGPSVRPQATTATTRHRSTAFSNLRGRTTSISTCTWISAIPPMTWTFTMSEN